MNSFPRFACALLCVIVLFCGVNHIAHAQQLTVIDLKHRTADEVLPLLRPLVGSDAALTGVDYRLLVRAGNADVMRIREALAVIDRAPKQMLVSVRYATQSQIASEHAGVSGRLSTGDSQLTVRAGRDTATREQSNVSSVRVLEGQAAFVASGARVPIVSAVMISRHRVGAVIEERNVSSGFQVLPRVNGDTVVLEVGAQQEQLQSGNRIAVQNVNTSVSGRVGEWLALGGVEETSNTTSSYIGGRRVATANDQRQIWIKVELVTTQ
jgi:hypothetical protein